MNVLRYPPRVLLGDFVRAGIGLFLTGSMAVLMPLGSTVQVIVGSLAALFALFGARTWARQRGHVKLDDAGIETSAFRLTRLEWAQVKSVKLAYYATRTDRAGGWMQLTLKADGGTARIDSTLDGFIDVARAAAAAAKANGLTLNEATRANFTSLGIATEASP